MSTQRQKTNDSDKTQVLMLASCLYGNEILKKDIEYSIGLDFAKELIDSNRAILSTQKKRYQNKMVKIDYEEI